MKIKIVLLLLILIIIASITILSIFKNTKIPNDITFTTYNTGTGISISYPKKWFIKEYYEYKTHETSDGHMKIVKTNLYWDVHSNDTNTFFSMPENEKLYIAIDILSTEGTSVNDKISNLQMRLFKNVTRQKTIKTDNGKIWIFYGDSKFGENGTKNILAIYPLPNSHLAATFLLLPAQITLNDGDIRCQYFYEIVKRTSFETGQPISFVPRDKPSYDDISWGHAWLPKEIVSSGRRVYNIIPTEHNHVSDPPILYYGAANNNIFSSTHKSDKYNYTNIEAMTNKPADWLINIFNYSNRKSFALIKVENKSAINEHWGQGMPEGIYGYSITALNPVSGKSMTWESFEKIVIDNSPPTFSIKVEKSPYNKKNNSYQLKMIFSPNESLDFCGINIAKEGLNGPETYWARQYDNHFIKKEQVNEFEFGTEGLEPGTYYFEIFAEDLAGNNTKVYSLPFNVPGP